MKLSFAFLSFTPFFAGFFLNLTRFWTKLRVLVLCFPDFTENSIFQLEVCNIFLTKNQRWWVMIRLGISVLPLCVYFSFALRKNMSVSVGPSNKYKAYFKTKEFSYTTRSITSWVWSVGWKITTISEQFPKQHNEHRHNKSANPKPKLLNLVIVTSILLKNLI